MTIETTDYEVENEVENIDNEIDIGVLQQQEYVEDLHVRHSCYLELIEEFKN